MPAPTATIYAARRIVTMNPQRPVASHVVVRDGRILGVGTLEELRGWGPAKLDDRFADKVLLPGFVEGHAHVMEGVLWDFVYCGYFDRMDPDGRVQPGARTTDATIERLVAAERQLDNPDRPLTGWAFDPIYLGNQRLTRHDLDRVSRTRPVGIYHASGHIMNVNSRALELAGWLRPGVAHDGIPLGEDGLPLGEMRGPQAMMPLGRHVGLDRSAMDSSERGFRNFARLCVRAGITTVTDLGSLLPQENLEMFLRLTAEADFPTRVVTFRIARGLAPEALVARALEVREMSTERLRLGRIKVVVDGSIQGFSARLSWPGYYNGAPNGLWYVEPEFLREVVDRALAAGVRVHFHTNGDQATQLVLDTMAEALRLRPQPGHRFTLQHCQLATTAQFRQMRELGMGVNLFANHHFYWGDQHYELTVGPERAERMNACATALANGVPLAIHCDAPVTPLGPLFTAWCAVNRMTASGRVLGEAERISVPDALRAITLGAAFSLGLDPEIGSIEAGKRADFAVLEEDPREVEPTRLKDVRVWGTVQGGRVFPAATI